MPRLLAVISAAALFSGCSNKFHSPGNTPRSAAKTSMAPQGTEWDMLIQADPMDILRRNIIRGMGRDPAAPTPSPDSGVTPPAASTEGPGFWENPYGYFFGSSADAGQPTPGGNGATPPAAPQQRRGRYPRPGRPGPGQPSPSVPIESMTEDQITALVYGGRELSEGDLARIDARLKALGR